LEAGHSSLRDGAADAGHCSLRVLCFFSSCGRAAVAAELAAAPPDGA
jgi:hypothetical protein